MESTAFHEAHDIKGNWIWLFHIDIGLSYYSKIYLSKKVRMRE